MDHGSDSGATPKLTLPLSATQLASHTVPTKMWAPLWAVLQATRVLLTQVCACMCVCVGGGGGCVVVVVVVV